MRNLAIFDLDNTLLAGDSDHLWGQYLVNQGLVDATEYERRNNEFYEQYKAGTLDIQEFVRFSFRPLADNEHQRLLELRAEFVENQIRPIIAPGSAELIRQHRERGDELLIITATNSFVTTPIAELLGITHLLGTDPEFMDGQFTGRLQGTPCFQDGKVIRLQDWLGQRGERFAQTTFYSDSINDAPLLELADYPYAVDPCDSLRALATQRGWPVISLR